MGAKLIEGLQEPMEKESTKEVGETKGKNVPPSKRKINGTVANLTKKQIFHVS